MTVNALYMQARNNWLKQVAELAGGYYADQPRADVFFERHLEPALRHACALDEKANVIKKLRITPTIRRVLHFFACAVLGKGRRAPRLTCWPPILRQGQLKLFRCAPKGDLAKLVGMSLGAIETALRYLRGRGPAGDIFKPSKIAVVVALESGILVDGSLDFQTSFPFNYEVSHYEAGLKVARGQRTETGDTHSSAMEHCQAGIEALTGKKPSVVLDEQQAAAQVH